MEKTKSIALVARVNITYKGESRSAAVYDDGTAVLDTGEVIELSKDQREKIMAKYAAAKKAEEEAERKAALKAQREAEKAAREKARRKAMERAAVDEDEEDNDDEYEEPPRVRWDAPSGPKKPSIAKLMATTLVYAAVIGGTLFGSTYFLDNYMNKVSVAQVSTQMAKDAQFTPDNLTRLKMPESVYEELNKAAPGGLVLWEDAQGVIGKYIAVDAVKGQYLSYDFVSDSRTMSNPWIQNIDDDAQLYTIQFDPYATYNQLLFAGSHVRMKAAISVLNENGKATGETEVRSVSAAAVAAHEDEDVSGEADESGEKASEPGADETNSQTGESKKAPSSAKTEKAEVEDRFGDVVVVDIINTSNESMFDVYLPLARMTRDERREFLTEKAKSAGAASYYARFTPMSLVFALDDEQVSELSKVEHMSNASITYTLLPSSSSEGTDDENSMYLRFMEVQRDVNEIFGDAMAAK